MKQINVGIIGCGNIAQSIHIPNLIENPKSKIIAICDKNKEQLKNIGNKFGIEKRFTNYKEMFESNLIDAVWVCTPTKTHSKIVIDAARSGIHTFSRARNKRIWECT